MIRACVLSSVFEGTPEACIRFHSLQASFFVTPVISLPVGSTGLSEEARLGCSTVAGWWCEQNAPREYRFFRARGLLCGAHTSRTWKRTLQGYPRRASQALLDSVGTCGTGSHRAALCSRPAWLPARRLFPFLGTKYQIAVLLRTMTAVASLNTRLRGVSPGTPEAGSELFHPALADASTWAAVFPRFPALSGPTRCA